MRIWPLSLMSNSPRLHHVHVWELKCIYYSPVLLSESTMIACNQLAAETPTSESPMAIINSDGTPMRMVYIHRPHPNDFARLERANFTATEDSFGFVVDALH